MGAEFRTPAVVLGEEIKMKMKRILTNPRVIIVLIILFLAIFAINPSPFNKGVAIRNILSNSSGEDAGLISPKANSAPMSREIITAIGEKPVKNLDEYYSTLKELENRKTFTITTNKQTYTIANNKELGIVVYDAPTSNIRKGLDLAGGTRVLLEPAQKLNPQDVSTLIDSMNERLNVYGLSDLVIRESNDLPPPFGTGNQYIIVEIAGATKEEVSELLAKQGKFEAKIGNQTVFNGGNDIKYVCKSVDCSGIDPQAGCGQYSGSWMCRFRFSISLSPEAATKQADITKGLKEISEGRQSYLEKPLTLYLDDVLVDELNIGAELKGKAVTDIQISGSGAGETQEAAFNNAIENMKKLQTILLTGSLPVKLEIVKMDTISAQLGDEFIKNAFLIAALAIISVSLLILIRYESIKISLAIIFTMVTEIVLMLAVAALIGWNLDLAGIAGIIITIGTAVNDQFIITDEILKGEKGETQRNWKQKIKNAFYIIMGAYFTVMVAMIPLLTAGAGLLKGFAITTIIGLSVGTFITRPAFGQIIEIIVSKDPEKNEKRI